MAASLFISGRWDNGTLHLPSSSLVIVFTIQSACSTVPLTVVLVDEESNKTFTNLTDSSNFDRSLCCNGWSEPVQDHLTVHHDVDAVQNNLSKLRIDPKSSSASSGEVPASTFSSQYIFPVDARSLEFPVLHNLPVPEVVRNTFLPAVLSEADHWCVVGACASLRYILQRAHTLCNDAFSKKLLGFREGCLQSCAEVSCWTKFCEVEMPLSLNNVFTNDLNSFMVPKEILRFNNHLSRPPILHNALKMKQQFIKKTVKDKQERDRLLSLKSSELPDLDHDFAEGLDITLADVMLLVCFDLIIYRLSELELDAISPLVMKWHKLISFNEHIQKALPILGVCKSKYVVHRLLLDGEVIIPKVMEESLYKSDPERPKLHCIGSMTLQRDIDQIISRLIAAGVEVEYSTPPAGQTIALPWTTYPPAVHPQDGALPPSRLERKCQQIENIVGEVIRLSKPGDIVVDFCSGGGHVGIVLAYSLPQCTVVLIENKASSLLRAKARIDTLALSNVLFYQCNLDYFTGRFNVGVCLHACGQATDLVLQKCYAQNAAFVCSPCCYGSIQPNHSVQYPRSGLYRQILPRLAAYLTLGHTADQTHGPAHPSTAQGQLCMRFIDDDRLVHANSLGYDTKLVLMQPLTCTPKNHMLIGTRKQPKSCS